MSSHWQNLELPSGFHLDFREKTGSTNDDIRSAANAGASEGLVIVARTQESGRGRRGAAWVCPPGEGLAFSALLRPRENKALWPRLSLAAGLAVAEAIERLGPLAEVKWPNDVWVGGRKIAGILVEAGDDFVVVGIGINVGVKEFPAELADSATSLALECGEAPELSAVLLHVLERLQVWSAKIGAGFEELLRGFRVRCALTGKVVRLLAADGSVSGKVAGIGDGGELLVETPNGVRRLVQADEVRITG